MNTLKVRKIVLLALIPVLLCIYILQVVSGNRNTVKYLTLEEEADTVLITKGDGTEIKVFIEGENWFAGDKKYPVDESTAKTLVSEISSLKLLETVSSSAADKARYGLDDASAVTAALYKDGKLLRTVGVGKASPTAQQTYITVDGGKDIYLSSGAITSDFAKSLDDIRSKKVYSLDVAKVTAATATTPADGSISVFRNSDDNSWLGGDSSKVSSWISNITSLNVQSWASENTVLPSEAAGSVTLTAEGRTITVSVYATDDESKYICTCSETPYPFYLSSYSAEKYIKTAADFMTEE
ncbi:MAG: DUF4340 domain-containing protein [Spirochaetaceae bacterium]|nr:DUF4340 domain-containing protein [Spirochaetaceae bacterium]